MGLERGAELSEFLRGRRARLKPSDVGLVDHGRYRRVPGLRREELAQLAGVSVAYYTRLDAPVAEARMIRHRKAHACGVERRRTHPSSADRSSSDGVNSAIGRPARVTRQADTSEQNS